MLRLQVTIAMVDPKPLLDQVMENNSKLKTNLEFDTFAVKPLYNNNVGIEKNII